MLIEVEKYTEKKYVLTLTFKELNALYHCAGNYFEVMKSLMEQHIGIRFTDGEIDLQKTVAVLVERMRKEEPRLFADLLFEF